MTLTSDSLQHGQESTAQLNEPPPSIKLETDHHDDLKFSGIGASQGSAHGGDESSESKESPRSRPANNKRSRVTRACDHCRLKKVKCDGKKPCIYCTVYSHNCTYDRPNIRSKNASAPGPGTQQADAILKLIAMSRMATTSTTSDNLVLAQNMLNMLFPKLNLNLLSDRAPDFDFKKFQLVVSSLQAKNPSSLNIHEISDIYLNESAPTSSPITHIDHGVSTASNEDSCGAEFKIFLPPKAEALELIFTTWTKACVLFRFYHRPSLLKEVDLLYSLDPSQYGDDQQRFLPFMYSLLACGSLFSKSTYTEDAKNDSLEDDGFNYFLEARRLIDISNVGDIPSIQTIVMLILYLQCSARLSTCYSYIGIALRSALKEGLHRNLSLFQSRKHLNPIEEDTRKRLFYTIYKMDIYINSLLGLPRSIGEDEFDQEYPAELDDELITEDGYLFEKQEGRLSSSACANNHTKLTIILSKIVKELYPVKVKQSGKDQSPIPDIHDKVTALELELKNWSDHLPLELRPTDPNVRDSNSHVPERFKLANYYLHFTYLNCQISLYRPFIHFISTRHLNQSDPRSLIRGRNCIKVARLVVKLANKMIDQNLLIGTYWFSMYTIFFSIACLIYYFHFANYNNRDSGMLGSNYAGVFFDDDLNIEMIRSDIEIGKKVLNKLKNMSNSSTRIYNILNKLFEQLNQKTAKNSMASRRPDSGNASGIQIQTSIDNFHQMNGFDNTAIQDYAREFVKGSTLEKKEAEDQLYQYFAKSNLHDNVTIGPVDTEETPGDKSISIGAIHPSDRAALSQEMSDVSWSESAHVQYSPVVKQHLSVDNPIKVAGEGDQNRMSDFTPLDYVPGVIDYVPGVIDAVDTQIFGRILPPYMLERNLRQAEEMESAGLTDRAKKPILSTKPEGQQNDLVLEDMELGDIELFEMDSLNPF